MKPAPSAFALRRAALLAAGILLISAPLGVAVNVNPGATQALSGTTFAANPNLGGSALRDVLLPFVIRDVSNNTPGISGLGAGATPDLTFNNAWNNQGFGNYNAQGGAVITPGIGSISVDPLVGSGYELLEGSPCINAGDPNPIYTCLDTYAIDLNPFVICTPDLDGDGDGDVDDELHNADPEGFYRVRTSFPTLGR